MDLERLGIDRLRSRPTPFGFGLRRMIRITRSLNGCQLELPRLEPTARYSVFKDRAKPPRRLYKAAGTRYPRAENGPVETGPVTVRDEHVSVNSGSEFRPEGPICRESPSAELAQIHPREASLPDLEQVASGSEI